jgi:hypothetical protein
MTISGMRAGWKHPSRNIEVSSKMEVIEYNGVFEINIIIEHVQRRRFYSQSYLYSPQKLIFNIFSYELSLRATTVSLSNGNIGQCLINLARVSNVSGELEAQALRQQAKVI